MEDRAREQGPLPSSADVMPLGVSVSASPAQAWRPWYPRSCVETDSVAGTERIVDDAISICIWRRGKNPKIRGYLDETSGLLVSGAQIHRMRMFDVGLFKGESWPNNAGRGAVHRSPALAERDPWRVRVSLDELD